MNTVLLHQRWMRKLYTPSVSGRLSLSDRVSLNESPEHIHGIWRSQGGSLYVSEGTGLVCVSVHSILFQGWLNKIAIKDIQMAGTKGVAKQAFRNPLTGQLGGWESIELEFSEKVLTKYFPAHISSGKLRYGYVENYSLVSIQ